MKPKEGANSYLYCLVTGLFALITWQVHASSVEVDWTSNGFSKSHITINAGDEVDIVNFDDAIDLLVQGAPPEAFSADIPANDGAGPYYLPYIYNTPGTYSFSDEFGGSVTVTVLSSLSLSITSPTNNATFAAPATFDVTAVPTNGTPPYLVVEFFDGTNLLGGITTPPFTMTISNLPAGTHEINALVNDSSFISASNSVVINVTSPLVPPQITALLSGNQIVLSWPTNNADAFSLQTSATLGASASWSALGVIPALLGDQWVVTNPISGPAEFFRLSN